MLNTIVVRFIAAGLLAGITPMTQAAGNWAAVVYDEDGHWGVARGYESKKKAIAEARSACKEDAPKGCGKVLGALNRAGYIAFVSSPSYYSAQVADTEEEAQQAAMDACVANTPPDQVCQLKLLKPNGNVANVRTAAPSGGDCRPRTANLTCRSQCMNGDCIVTYENGCKMRMRVNARINPFTNQFEYPSPSC